MKILIDGDGCPVVKETIEIARQLDLDVVVVTNYAHELESDYAKIVRVDFGRDVADLYIANHMEKGDLVISQDYGLAAMVIAKAGFVINQYGTVINSDNIDMILSKRHFNKKLRERHGKYTKFKKRTKEDNINYTESLKRQLLIWLES